VDKRAKWRAAQLWHIYQDGWELLTHWVACEAPDGRCHVEVGLRGLGIEPGDLLVALCNGDPTLIGAPRRHP